MSKSCCHICVDPNCGGKKSCDCDRCKLKDKCPRYVGIKPTIRITRRCTQACSHCCFECSPQVGDSDMSQATAENISTFCKANDIHIAEIMGGEFFTHPSWASILTTLVQPLARVRLVSNGDWAGNPDEVIEFLRNHTQIHVGISKDRWHTNKHVDKAAQLLEQAGIPFKVATSDQTGEESIVPVGRHKDEWSPFYSMFSTYCSSPERHYSILIDENGKISKCSFGSWQYATVDEYLIGGFSERFKDFTSRFYNVFIPNCTACQRAAQARKEYNNKWL